MMDDFTEEGLRLSLRAQWVPENIHAGLVQWVRVARRAGDFLDAVLRNDLRETLFRADLGNRQGLHATCIWLFNFAPAKCSGSYELVEAWNNLGGMAGLEREAETRASGGNG